MGLGKDDRSGEQEKSGSKQMQYIHTCVCSRQYIIYSM